MVLRMTVVKEREGERTFVREGGIEVKERGGERESKESYVDKEGKMGRR